MKPPTQHMITVLKATLRALGFTNREVESRLGVSRGYLTRLFSGVMDLRFDHVAEIAEVIGVEPEEILRLAFPPSTAPVNAMTARLRDALGVTPPEPAEGVSAESSALERELERIVAKTFRKMFAAGLDS
ncbi:MAG TPA: helix-turn-helix transcriptional regulator [Thermoanaerobaculia bacterium]|jgi:transcriptional regulator with XRE-family HTH domain|nr:helix-turn-helix transcriptional regulator [Thermoanaerobaculia bacterium]